MGREPPPRSIEQDVCHETVPVRGQPRDPAIDRRRRPEAGTWVILRGHVGAALAAG